VCCVCVCVVSGMSVVWFGYFFVVCVCVCVVRLWCVACVCDVLCL